MICVYAYAYVYVYVYETDFLLSGGNGCYPPPPRNGCYAPY